MSMMSDDMLEGFGVFGSETEVMHRPRRGSTYFANTRPSMLYILHNRPSLLGLRALRWQSNTPMFGAGERCCLPVHSSKTMSSSQAEQRFSCPSSTIIPADRRAEMALQALGRVSDALRSCMVPIPVFVSGRRDDSHFALYSVV